MMQYRITFDLSALGFVLDRIGEQAYRAVNLVVRQTAEEVRQSWQSAVHQGLPIRDAWTRARNDAAVDSIKAEPTGAFSSVVWSGNHDVYELETGRPERDLKRMLGTSSRTKVSKAGRKYLTIPMRHGSEGSGALSPALPRPIYLQARALDPSSITGRQMRPNAHGRLVPSSTYAWGGRLPAGLAPKLKPQHRADPYAGAVRMQDATGKTAAFLTFRTMSEDSQGWIMPAKPGQHIARGIATQAQADFGRRILDALRKVGV